MLLTSFTLDLLKSLSSSEELRESIRQMVQTAVNDLVKVELDSAWAIINAVVKPKAKCLSKQKLSSCP
jgi:hypothetical protein